MNPLTVLLAIWISSAAERTADSEIKPAITWSDIDSKIAIESFRCIRSTEEWEKQWKAHKVGSDPKLKCPPCPTVDFESYMVVALFRGKSGMDSGMIVDSIHEGKDSIRIQYHPNLYSVFVTEHTNPRAFDTQSYAFVLLPKRNKVIIIEEKVPGTRQDSAAVATWRERARVAPPK